MSSRKGFTLVELAIVLVIVGLLIGGILAAQSMSGTAKVTAQVKQIQQFDIAVTNFKTNYGGLPGDTAKISPGTANGDGLIDVTNCCGGQEWMTNENGYFWTQLTTTQMFNDTHSYTSGWCSTASWPSTCAPTSPLNPKAGTVAYGITSLNKNYYNIVCGNSSNYFAQCPSINPVDALALDSKMDDGDPSAGTVVARNGPDSQTTTLGNGWWNDNCTAVSGKYNVSGTTGYITAAVKCNMRIEMLAQTGQQ